MALKFSSITEALRTMDYVLHCEVPGCKFESSARGIVSNFTDEDADLMTKYCLDSNFRPTREDIFRLQEIFGSELECPEHGKLLLGFTWKSILFNHLVR